MSGNPGDYARRHRLLLVAVADALEADGCDPDLSSSVSAALWNLAMEATAAQNRPEEDLDPADLNPEPANAPHVDQVRNANGSHR
jgi:hypothetical protein